MKKHIKWLIAEIDGWVNAGIIAPDQGQALKDRYPAPSRDRPGAGSFFLASALLIEIGLKTLGFCLWRR